MESMNTRARRSIKVLGPRGTVYLDAVFLRRQTHSDDIKMTNQTCIDTNSRRSCLNRSAHKCDDRD